MIVMDVPNTPLQQAPMILVAASSPQSTMPQALLDYTLTLTLTEGEELMFTMDVPYVPAQDTPIVLVQAATPNTGIPQPDYLLKACHETEHTTDPRSALRGVDPAGMLGDYIQGRDHRNITSNPSVMASIKISMLEGTKHGKIFAEVDNDGLTSYHYDPEPGYLGKDRAVFMAEFEGKRYKIVVVIKVLIVIDQNSNQCPEPQLIKLKPKPTLGSSSYDLGSATVSFAALEGGALGQTTGSTITLDANAAGYNWYVDLTPQLNEEYLPTADANVWQARPGSDAAGKMDMLSVLLHEYGHVLGIEHSADRHAAMAATLQPGTRRLPSADELALMAQLVGEVKTGLTNTPETPKD